jgi:DNA polymerase-1
MNALSWKEKPTGVIYGFLKGIPLLMDEFATGNVVFCFESKTSHRRNIFPAYKQRRVTKKRDPEEAEAYDQLRSQISELRQRYLPKIGFKNVLSWDGLESDDIMAKIALTHAPRNEVVLVTSDSDLWQVLGPRVSVYDPGRQVTLTEEWFRGKYGIAPKDWAKVKALGGCKSDEVPGIPGVGETTALKFLRGELGIDSRAFDLIGQGKSIVRRNRKLVQLPFEGSPGFTFQEHEVTRDKWKEVCEELGMKSIIGRPPVPTRKSYA